MEPILAPFYTSSMRDLDCQKEKRQYSEFRSLPNFKLMDLRPWRTGLDSNARSLFHRSLWTDRIVTNLQTIESVDECHRTGNNNIGMCTSSG